MVQIQPRQKVHKSPSQSVVGSGDRHLSSQLHRKCKSEDLALAGPCIKLMSISKITNTQETGRMAQVVECLPNNVRS
jgi:hypothetical protein